MKYAKKIYIFTEKKRSNHFVNGVGNHRKMKNIILKEWRSL